MRRSNRDGGRVYEIEPEPARDLSFSKEQRIAIYVAGFILSIIIGASGGYLLAVIAWAVAHGHVSLKRSS